MREHGADTAEQKLRELFIDRYKKKLNECYTKKTIKIKYCTLCCAMLYTLARLAA